MSGPSCVAAGFASLFGRPPDGVWAAPGRLNVIGEFTDYNDGFVLPIALGAVTLAAVGRRADAVVRVASADAPEGERVVTAHLEALQPGEGGWAGYALGVLWALGEGGRRLGGLDVYVESTVPVGAGLSSSAALECSVALAVRDLLAPDMGRTELAAAAQRAENAFVGVPTGRMDQTASLCCRAGRALLLDTRSGHVEQLPFDLDGEGLTLLVLDTRVRHRLVASGYADRRRMCEDAARRLGLDSLRDAHPGDLARLTDGPLRQRARHVVTENGRVLDVVRLVRSGRTSEIGPVLDASHQSLALDFAVSSPELDLAASAAREGGALGARMVGGGFGGCVAALVPSAGAGAVVAAVRRAFDREGLPVPGAFPAVPSDGARRLA